ncbi:MAG: hypothetical protein ACFE8O_04875 [Candidatus Hermodarchaeota archaeon]
MPAVYYIARQMQRHLSGELVDFILLLWLYSNPHETRRRTMASLRHVLKHTPEFQRPDGQPNVTDKELNQIVFSSLQRLKDKGFVVIYGEHQFATQISLTEKGTGFIQNELSPESLQFLEDSGHMT